MTNLVLRPDADGRLSPGDLRTVRELLAAGGVVAVPAESCYGLSARADSDDGIARIGWLKGSRSRSFIVAVGERSQLVSLGVVASPRLLDRLFEIWPAPVSFVLPLRGPVAADAGRSGSIAVRLPVDPILRGLSLALGVPLVTTSANREGERPARSATELLAIWPEGLDAIVDGGDRIGGPPSTLVDLASEPGRVLREGAWQADPERLRELSTAAAENPSEDST